MSESRGEKVNIHEIKVLEIDYVDLKECDSERGQIGWSGVV